MIPMFRLSFFLLALPFVGCALPDPGSLGLQIASVETATPEERTVELNELHNPDVDLPAVEASPDRLEFISCNVDGPYLAMTFDDGPHPTLTPKLLDILAKRNIKCTFFVLGPLVKRFPDIVKRIVAEGHEVANHTMTHRDIRKIPLGRLHKELKEGHKLLVEVTGQKPILFRPPFGGYNDRLTNIIYKEYGYPMIIWSVDSNDWKRPGVDKVTNTLINDSHNGAILIAHDIHTPTIQAMPKALDGILERGFTFVTVSQLIGLERSQGRIPANYRTNLAAVKRLSSFGPGDL
jgi:peptidoglycan/xylan/chitin deacetylase (PgdA/CDA1 family)